MFLFTSLISISDKTQNVEDTCLLQPHFVYRSHVLNVLRFKGNLRWYSSEIQGSTKDFKTGFLRFEYHVYIMHIQDLIVH